MDSNIQKSINKKSEAMDTGATDGKNKKKLMRRISFSGRSSVREFREEEEPKTWKNTYEISDHLNVDGSASLHESTEAEHITGATKTTQNHKEAADKLKNPHKLVKSENIQLIRNHKSLSLLKNTSIFSSSKDLVDATYQNSGLDQIENSLDDITLFDREMKFRVKENKENENIAANIYSFSMDDREKECQAERTIDYMSDVKSGVVSLRADIDIAANDLKKSFGKNEDAPEVLSICMNESAIKPKIEKIKTTKQNVSMQLSDCETQSHGEKNIKTVSIPNANKTVFNSFDMEIEDINVLENEENVNVEEDQKHFENKLNCISFLQDSDDNIKHETAKLQNIAEDMKKCRQTDNSIQPIETSPQNTENVVKNGREKTRATINPNQTMDLSPKRKINHREDVSVKNLKSRRTIVFNESIFDSPLSEFKDKKEIVIFSKNEKIRETIYLNQPIVEDFNKKIKYGAIPKKKARPTINFNQSVKISPDKSKAEFSNQTINSNKDMHSDFTNALQIPITDRSTQTICHIDLNHIQQITKQSFDDGIKKVEKKKIQDYFDFDVPQYNNGKEKNNKICQYSQEDDLMLDSTSFLAKAKLSDETQSRNSSKKEFVQLDDSMSVFNESLKEDVSHFGCSFIGSSKKYMNNNICGDVCSLPRNANPIFTETIEKKKESNLKDLNQTTKLKKTNTLACSSDRPKNLYRQTIYLNDDIELCDSDSLNTVNKDRVLHIENAVKDIASNVEAFYLNDMDIDESEKQPKENQLLKDSKENELSLEEKDRRQTIYPNSDIENVWNTSKTLHKDNYEGENFESRNICPGVLEKLNKSKDVSDNLALQAEDVDFECMSPNRKNASPENTIRTAICYENNNPRSRQDNYKRNEDFDFHSKQSSRTMYFDNHSNNDEKMVLATPVTIKTSKPLFYLTPQLSLIEFTNIEKQTEHHQNFSSTRSGLVDKRFSSNSIPLTPDLKRRQTLVFNDCSMDESVETILKHNINEDENHLKAPLFLRQGEVNDNVKETLDIPSNEPILTAAPSQKELQIPLPKHSDNILNICESKKNRSSVHKETEGKLYDIEDDNFSESIQMMRRSTTFLPTRDVPMEHIKKDNDKKCTFGENPITVSDVSEFFEAQRKSQIVVEDIDKTRLSLVEASYDYEGDDQGISKCEENRLDSMNSKTSIPSKSTHCANKSIQCCQDSLLNETSSSSLNALLPKPSPLPDLGLDRLMRLRQRPTISDVYARYQSRFQDRVIKKETNISNNSSAISDIDDNVDDEVTTIIRYFENKMQAFEKDLLDKQLLENRITEKQLTFVERLNNLLSDSKNWIFNFQTQYSGMLIFYHRKTYTFQLLLTYEEIDPFGYDINVKNVKVIKGDFREKYWKPIDFVISFQLKLNLPYDLKSLCKTSNEIDVFEMLQTIDSICVETVKMGNRLLRIGFINRALVVRNGCRIFLRKIIRKILDDKGVFKEQYVEKTVIEIELLNLKKLSFKDIVTPPLHKFCEEIQLLPVGLEFLNHFLPNPLLYLKKT